MKIWLLAIPLVLCANLLAETITIGQDAILNQGLPIEPVARYTYSQQLFMADEIGCGGIITSLGFHYNVSSNLFFEGNRQWKIWLGHSARTNMSAGWVPIDSLSLVFDGLLNQSDFLAGLPGNGWLQMALSTTFNYTGNSNLILAVDENGSDYGSTSDDFLSTNNATQLAVQFQSASLNPDPNSPPISGFTYKTHRSNLQIGIEALHYIPVQPNPANGASGVAIDGNFSWQSLCQSFSLSLGTHPDSLQVVASSHPLPFWQPETPLLHNKQYFWQVTGNYYGQQFPSPIWSFSTCTEDISPPQQLSGYYNGTVAVLSWQAPLVGNVHYYKVYRNSAFYTSGAESNFQDSAVLPGLTYYYYVTAVNPSGNESGASNLISLTIPPAPPDALLYQGFEPCSSFSTLIPNWQNLDLDNSPTWAWDNVSYPHEGENLPWLCFAPSETTPPLSGYSPYLGTKMLMAMSALSPPNNDWLISPAINLGQNPSLSFYARSAVADFGLERLRVLVSTTTSSPSSFTPLHASPYLSLPIAWTPYNYDLSAYQNQRIYLAWNCVSVDAFALFLDEIKVVSTGGWVNNSDEYISSPAFRTYPNPCSESFKVDNKSGQAFNLEVYNLKGQRLFRSANLLEFSSNQLQLSSGLYLLRITQNGSSYVLKQVVLK